MKKNSKIKRFFSNDITLLVVSVILSFAIWFVVNANSSTQMDFNKTISDIPIVVELSEDAVEDGLEVFTDRDITASVEVTGNRMTVGALDKDDIKVEAYQSNTIIAPGSYTLELSASKNSSKSNYNFVSNVSPSSITVFVDKRKDKEFSITDEIVYKVEEGYYPNSALSQSTITVSGPETEVSAIDRVIINGTMEGVIGNTKTQNFDLVFLDKESNQLDIKMSTLSATSVEVSLTPLPTLEVELTVDTVNAPAKHPRIKISPSKIKIAAEQEVLDSIVDNKVNIGTLDFATLSNKKISEKMDIVLPNKCKNLSDSKQAKVSVDLSSYAMKKVTINSFKTENIDNSIYSVAFNSPSIEVSVCGPQSLISQISSADIIAKVDFADKLNEDFKDSTSFDLSITFDFVDKYVNCWVYDKYVTSVSVTKK